MIVRSSGPASLAVPAIRGLVRQMDPALPLFDVTTIGELMERRLVPQRAAATVLNMFGALALFLAAIGVYGLIAFTVSRRSREIGVRQAIGATPADMLQMVMADATSLALWGVGIGLLAAFGATRLVSGMVSGAALIDVPMLAAASVLVAAVVLIASYVPARRATKVDPAVVLRAE
jgi:putative ABC transport system permease protein